MESTVGIEFWDMFVFWVWMFYKEQIVHFIRYVLNIGINCKKVCGENNFKGIYFKQFYEYLKSLKWKIWNNNTVFSGSTCGHVHIISTTYIFEIV